MNARNRFMPGVAHGRQQRPTPELHRRPPFDEAVHERSFGLWRADGSPKPAVAEITQRVGRGRLSPPTQLPWLDIGVDEFADDPGRHLARLYRRYRQRGT